MRDTSFASPLALISGLIGGLGMYVVAGWLSGSEEMVRVLPNSVAMGLNTALMFLAAAAALVLGTRSAYGNNIATALAIGIVLLSGLILIEHTFDVSLGIDFSAMHGAVKDGNPRPGRTAPNTCLGFLFAGLAMIALFRMEQQSRIVRQMQTILITVVGMIGLTALIGYILQLEVMYRIAVYNRMAAPTALAMFLVGIALSLLQYRSRRNVGLKLDSPDARITKIAALVLTIVALATGLTGFVILKDGFEQSISNAMLRDAKSDASAFASILS